MSTQVLKFDGNDIRFVFDEDDYWIACKDLMVALEYSSISNATNLFKQVPEEWKKLKTVDTPGGQQKLVCVKNQGVNLFLERSDKPKARRLQRWIAQYVSDNSDLTESEHKAKCDRTLEQINSMFSSICGGTFDFRNISEGCVQKSKVKSPSTKKLPKEKEKIDNEIEEILNECGRKLLLKLLKDSGRC